MQQLVLSQRYPFGGIDFRGGQTVKNIDTQWHHKLNSAACWFSCTCFFSNTQHDYTVSQATDFAGHILIKKFLTCSLNAFLLYLLDPN